ncbi:MAG: aryl-sulfate sulfotransferase [Erysipelotrichaceae bacterium]|nr:aryl-sulfate sulfotransferase [Erysipelotrichaceae bacterium]
MAEQIGYEKIEHIIFQQNKAEKAMLEEFHSGNYTLENPLVKYNAYLVNPLSAVILFNTEKETAITVRVLGKTKEATISHTFPKAKEHVLPILDLYSDYENTVEIEAYRSQKTTIKINVPDVYNGEKVINYMKTTAEYLQDNLIFVSPAGEKLSSAFDFNGDPRWHMTIPCVFDLKRLKNGNLIIGSSRLVKMPYYMSGIYEMSLVGKIYKEYRVPGGYHHDEFELPDGNLLSLTEDLRTDTVEDMCVMINRETGEIMKTWDYKDYLDPDKVGKSGSWTDADWFHNNAVWYDENTNSLTFSGRHIDSMCNIDYDTGKLNWIIGDPEMWPEEYQKYFFTPVGDGEFDWQYEQHANVILPDGDVMCFDNGHFRSKVPEKRILNKDNFSRGVRYRINTDDMTIKQIWQYGKERSQEFYSQYICNVEYYGEGHYMVHSGGIQYYGDDASEEFAAMMQDDPMVRTRSITVEVLDDEVMLELEVKGNFYRAEKLKLYHDQDNLPLGDGVSTGHMGVTKEFDTIIPAEPCGEELPYVYEASINEEPDRFTFKATFESGQLVMLMLEQGEEQHGYYISTAKTKFAALCCGTFIEKDARNITCSVNKYGLKGTYDVRVVVDDKKYETGIQITC